MVAVSVKTAMSFNRHGARAFIECNPTPPKFCWRMLELTRLCALWWSKPCTLALLSRHGAEHLLLLARVQRRIILWVYTRLSICSWKWIICSLVVQKGLLAPTTWDSLGSSVRWNVLALAQAQQTQHLQGGPEDMGLGKSATIVRRILISFSFFVALACSAAIPLRGLCVPEEDGGDREQRCSGWPQPLLSLGLPQRTGSGELSPASSNLPWPRILYSLCPSQKAFSESENMADGSLWEENSSSVPDLSEYVSFHYILKKKQPKTQQKNNSAILKGNRNMLNTSLSWRQVFEPQSTKIP